MRIDELAKQYVELRAKKAKMEKIAKERIDVIKQAMVEVENKMFAFLQESGQDSAKTKHGTPYKKLTTAFNVSNADEFFEYVIKNNAVDLLTKKVNSTTAKSYMDDKIKIPGVKIYMEEKIGFRKS